MLIESRLTINVQSGFEESSEQKSIASVDFISLSFTSSFEVILKKDEMKELFCKMSSSSTSRLLYSSSKNTVSPMVTMELCFRAGDTRIDELTRTSFFGGLRLPIYGKSRAISTYLWHLAQCKQKMIQPRSLGAHTYLVRKARHQMRLLGLQHGRLWFPMCTFTVWVLWQKRGW